VAGVTIEDKLFPKTNSFLRSELQPLADVEEFCGKIKAGKDSQTDADFVLVARVEALIAGWASRKPSSARRPIIARAPTRSSSTAASRAPPRSSRSSTSGATARPWCWCRRSTGARPPRSSARAA